MNLNRLPEKRKKLIEIILLLIAFALLTFFAGKPIINAVSDPESFRQWVNRNGMWGKCAFLGMMFIQTVIAFIPGEPLEIAAGYAFGAVWGTVVCLVGQGLGSVCVFLIVKKFGMRLVEVFVSREKIESLKFLKDEKKLDALVFFVFLMPGTPKDALCYFVGLTKMKLKTWFLISTFARLPSIVTSTIGGNALGDQRFLFAVIVFGATMLVSAAGYCAYNRIMKRRAGKQDT